MKPDLIRIVASALMLSLFAVPTVWAQSAPPAQDPAGTQPAAPLAAAGPLDQLLAPIALYPDQLLGQILMAATYSLEVVQADRWAKDPQNAGLKGGQLATALQPIEWDPSVKSLVPFPQILAMMDQQLDWTQKLGDAFLAQQPDVMDAVQRLRQQAQAAGDLRSTPQETVTPVGQNIEIQPASPQVVYVPVYDPRQVYGAWRYPAYPPIYFQPPPGFYVGPPIRSGIGFSIGFGVLNLLWGWNNFDWEHHRVRVDYERVNVINRVNIERNRVPQLSRDTWEHDATHRRGQVYRDTSIRDRLRPSPAGAPDTRRDFRGFTPPSARPAIAAAPPRENRPQQAATSRGPETPVRPQREEQRVAPAAAVRPPVVVGRSTASPVFRGLDRGADARAHAERGRASLQSAPPARATPQHAEPAARPARSEAAARPSGGQGGKPPDNDKNRR